MSKRLLLVGAGHSHLEVLRRLTEERIDDVDICMVSPSRYQYYSGMFSGYTEGLYATEDTRIDVRQLARQARVHFIEKRAVEVRPKQHKLICHDRSVYPFDVISFDIGSRSLPEHLEETQARTIKPNYTFIEEIERIRETTHPLVVGGGAAGTEIALSLHAYKEKQGIPGNVRLVTSERLLPDTPSWVSKRMESLFEKKGIQVWENEKVEEVDEDYIMTGKGNKIRHTGVLWLGGAVSDPIFKHSDLDTDDKGFAHVESTLQFKDYPFMFGAGDCVTMLDHPKLPKSGVYAVRQGPVLADNLYHFFKKEPLQEYDPQKQALYILSVGHQKGFLIYGPVSFCNRRAWKMKNKIDRDFMKKYK
ncbi:pyridine nucleotide-disulfide oxidoreductase [Halobacillus fulvus]|nr:pyridine nucleotide-disulfide oxidoreductase [Halobacillus fulvus]